MCSTVLLFSVWSSGPVGLSKGSMQVNASMSVPSSHHWPPAKVPSTPPLLSVSSYLPVKASGAGWGPIRVRKRIAGPDTHSPEPLQALVLYFSPVFVNGNLQMNGLICFQTVGMNLSVREQVSRRASAEQKTAWMGAEHYLSLVDFLNVPCPWWEETDLLYRFKEAALQVRRQLFQSIVVQKNMF